MVMAIAFIDKAPSEEELIRLKLFMSIFRDGTGQETDETGTRAGWRDIERVVAELLGGEALEKKEVYDVIIKPNPDSDEVYGISVKSKCLGRKNVIDQLTESGRVYMELTNSPAKLWEPLKTKGVHEGNFGDNKFAQTMGDSILTTVHGWYTNYHNKKINISKSIHLVFSYSSPKDYQEERVYQVHSFPLGFPSGIKWEFASDKCLRGFDPNFPEEVLLDWYGLSGGQLKFYPKASTAIFYSNIFALNKPRILTLSERAAEYWPKQWKKYKND